MRIIGISPAFAGARPVAALDTKVLDNAVEDGPVVVALQAQLDKVATCRLRTAIKLYSKPSESSLEGLTGARGLLGKQGELNVPCRGQGHVGRCF